MVDSLWFSRQPGQEISAPSLARLLKVALSTSTPVDTSRPVVGHTNTNVPIVTSLNPLRQPKAMSSQGEKPRNGGTNGASRLGKRMGGGNPSVRSVSSASRETQIE